LVEAADESLQVQTTEAHIQSAEGQTPSDVVAAVAVAALEEIASRKVAA
jgi:hypothetical protein